MQTVTETSYDKAGRLLCAAVRMNPAEFAMPPRNACLTGLVDPANGPDRISRSVYDEAGQPIEVGRDRHFAGPARGAYGYDLDGRKTSLTDARGQDFPMFFPASRGYRPGRGSGLPRLGGGLREVRMELDRKSVADLLQRFVEGDGPPWELDDFASARSKDPLVEACRMEILQLPGLFPPEEGSHYTSGQGIERILEMAQRLREAEVSGG
ncbi:MAG: hypothetical protein QOG72_3047 [Sphingomonadales bacterium]|nr:hypothetical protein [Sphingomonadales bacterium]